MIMVCVYFIMACIITIYIIIIMYIHPKDCGTIGEICESNHCCEDQRENPRVKLDDEGSYSCNHPSDLLTDLKVNF